MSDHESYSVESVNTRERAQTEIEVARENGVDPLDIARSHISIGWHMQQILKEES